MSYESFPSDSNLSADNNDSTSVLSKASRIASGLKSLGRLVKEAVTFSKDTVDNENSNRDPAEEVDKDEKEENEPTDSLSINLMNQLLCYFPSDSNLSADNNDSTSVLSKASRIASGLKSLGRLVKEAVTFSKDTVDNENSNRDPAEEVDKDEKEENEPTDSLSINLMNQLLC
ncbi:hypothetical protein ROZALSC1DRAFT_25771 [Rozella allomycis CSF55]|uniref:Uncharacterized protein n=1 Tax=Rozella allomycis (strain CSF55) TaxID=988480 RepID=A0A4P9YA70_ROZAC|nr:hypothetical protein ROZALSC1DRAFT_25771 [Rozella allomycis CSF55]